MLPKILERFVARSPLSVMAQACLERLLSRSWVDGVFEATAQEEKESRGQYTRTLLFSSVFDLMVRVVFCRSGSIKKAYEHAAEQGEPIEVSLVSVYNKLNGVAPRTSAALVRESGHQCARMVEQMGGCRPELLKGYTVRILDGNCLAATHHRIRELRGTSSGALPGKSLVVYDPAAGCVLDVVPCEDGHAQERSLLPAIFPMVRRRDLWIGDRNFCTRGFIEGVRRAGAHVLLREHQHLPVVPGGRERRIGHSETGEVFEQPVSLRATEQGDGEATKDVAGLRLRRIIVRLKKPTRDGDREIRLITSLPRSVDAVKISDLYRRRWRIETAFQELQRDLRSEIVSLGHPRAALFGFCVAVMAYNIMALTYGALRAQHGAERIDERFSHHALADHLARIHGGLVVATDPPDWRIFATMSERAFMARLSFLAKQVRIEFFTKAKRPAKPPKRTVKKYDPGQPHVSTAKLLAARKVSP